MMDLKIEHSLVNWVRFFNPVFYYYVFKINFSKVCNNNFIFIFLFLGLEIWKDNMRTFEETLISNVLPTLLAESSSIIAEERWSDLSLLYFLVKSVKGEISPIIEQFDEYMNHRREMLLNISAPGPEGPKSPDEFVNRIVDFHAKHIKLIEQVFDGDSNFITPLDKTCHFVINHNPNSKTHCPAIDLVRYLFALLFYLNKIGLILL